MKRLAIPTLLVLVVLASSGAVAGPAVAPSAATLTAAQLKTMSLEQMQAKGEEMVAETRVIASKVLDALSAAQKEKDFQRLNCIGDVMTTVKGLVRLSEQNGLSLRERVIAKDRAAAEHEFIKISISRNKAIDMQAQAKGCGGPGGDTVFEGAPLVERLFDKDLPQDDNLFVYDPVVIIDPPPSASPQY